MKDSLDNDIKIVSDHFISADVRINVGSSLRNKYILGFRVEPTAGEDWHFVDIWVSENQLRDFIEYAKRILSLTSNIRA
jgi:hypothetical protein